MSGRRDIHIGEDLRAAAEAAAARWVEIAAAAIRARGAFHVALAGGSTPRALYGLLAAPERRDRIDWRKVGVWFGDERCVPPTHPDSNYRMAQETLLSHVACPAAHIHRMEAERDPASAARDYERLLRGHLPPPERPGGPPRLDLILLGLGTDGHVASLFPDTGILEERTALAAAVYVPKLAAWRISLTYPMIEAARLVMMLVAGGDKAAIVAEVLGARAARYPAGRLQTEGPMEWYLDRTAAGRLEGAEA